MSNIYDWSDEESKNSGSDELIEWREGQKPNTVNNSARTMMKRIREYLHDTGGTCEGVITLARKGQVGTVIRIKTKTTMKEYKDGTVIRFIAVGSGSRAVNTDGSTILVGDLPPAVAYIATHEGIQPLAGGEIFAGSVYTIVYRSTGQYIGWHVLNPTRALLHELHRPQRLPSGMIMNFGMRAIPEGWLPCDGRAYKRWDYPYLFSRIGLSWGEGDGETTFNVPDLRGLFVRGSSPDHPFATYEADLIQSYRIQGRAEEYDANRERPIVEVPSAPDVPVPEVFPDASLRPPVISPYDAPVDEKTKVLTTIVQWALTNQNALYTVRRHHEAVDKLKVILRNKEVSNDTLKGIMRWAKKQPQSVLQDIVSDLLNRKPVREVHKAAFQELNSITKSVFKSLQPSWFHRMTTKKGLAPPQIVDEMIMKALYGWQRYGGRANVDLAPSRGKRSVEKFIVGTLVLGFGVWLGSVLFGKKRKKLRVEDLDVQYVIGGDPAIYPYFKYPYAPVYFDSHGYLINPNTCRRVSPKNYFDWPHYEVAREYMLTHFVRDPHYPEPCSYEQSACAWGFIRGESCPVVEPSPHVYTQATLPFYLDTDTGVYFDTDGYLMNPNTCMRTSKKAYPEFLARAKLSTTILFKKPNAFFKYFRDPNYPSMCDPSKSVCPAIEADREDARRRKKRQWDSGKDLRYTADKNPFKEKYPNMKKAYGTDEEREESKDLLFTEAMRTEVETQGYPNVWKRFMETSMDGDPPYYTNSILYFDSLGCLINPNTKRVYLLRDKPDELIFEAAFEQAQEYTTSLIGSSSGLHDVSDSRYPTEIRTPLIPPPKPPAPPAPPEEGKEAAPPEKAPEPEQEAPKPEDEQGAAKPAEEQEGQEGQPDAEPPVHPPAEGDQDGKEDVVPDAQEGGDDHQQVPEHHEEDDHEDDELPPVDEDDHRPPVPPHVPQLSPLPEALRPWSNRSQDLPRAKPFVYSDEVDPFAGKFPDTQKKYGTDYEMLREKDVLFTEEMKREIQAHGYTQDFSSFKTLPSVGHPPFFTNSVLYFDSSGRIVNPNTREWFFKYDTLLFPAAFLQAQEYTATLGYPHGFSTVSDSRYSTEPVDRSQFPDVPETDDEFDYEEPEAPQDVTEEPMYPIALQIPETEYEEFEWYDSLGYRVNPMTCLRSHVEEDRQLETYERITRATHAMNQSGSRWMAAIRFYNYVGEDFPTVADDPMHKPPKDKEQPDEQAFSDALRKEYLKDLKDILQHTHHFESDLIGGVETRPVNVAVNFAIKV